MAPGPLAQLDDPQISRRMAHGCEPLPHAACRAMPPTTRTSACPTTSSCSSIARSILGVGLLGAVVSLSSFVVILWGLSNAAPLHLFGVHIPGYLVWRALIYAVFGTALTQLDRLAAGQSQLPSSSSYEADFRFNLVRVRENSEQIALLKARTPSADACYRFGRVVGNWYDIMSRTKRLTAFTQSYAQAAVIFPFVLVAPAYFAGTILLGVMIQTAEAFGKVQEALSFFVSVYRTMAEWRAVVARLDGFEMSIARRRTCRARATIDPGRPATAAGIDLEALRCVSPTAGRWSQPTASHPAPRALAGDRPLRLRQVDAVPGDRRHLAVRHGHHRHPCAGAS